MGKPTVDPGGESEQDRFATLIRQHYQALYRAAYRLTRSTVDAEDLVQEVCLRAYPRLGEIERLEQPRGWLMRVLYRLFVPPPDSPGPDTETCGVRAAKSVKLRPRLGRRCNVES